jgi:hypothetical protein
VLQNDNDHDKNKNNNSSNNDNDISPWKNKWEHMKAYSLF